MYNKSSIFSLRMPAFVEAFEKSRYRNLNTGKPGKKQTGI